MFPSVIWNGWLARDRPRGEAIAIHTLCLLDTGPVMCQHLCFVLFLISQRSLLFGRCAINMGSCVCASLSSFLFSLPPSLACTPCCMWLPQGVKGQPGEKVSPHFPLCSFIPASASTSWTLGGAFRGPSSALLLGHAGTTEVPAVLAVPSQPLTALFPNSFRQETWASWAKAPASLAEGATPPAEAS